MRVLLTGAAGFIGGAVRSRLLDAGHDVVSLDAFIPEAHGPHLTDEGEGIHRVDLRRGGEDLTALLADVDVVCHQAAMVGAGLSTRDLPGFAGHNDLGTAVLLATMAAAGVDKLVLASSMVVYGDGRYACERHGEQPATTRALADLEAGRFDVACPVCRAPMSWQLVDEDARLSPLSSYAASKLAQEHYAAAWARQLPGRVVSLRYHNVYGPGMPPDTPYAGVAAIFRSAVARGVAPRVFEDGRQMRDFVHVEDVARANQIAIEAVAQRPGGTDRAFNVCSGQPISIRDVAVLLASGAGRADRAGRAGSADGDAATVVTGEFRPGDVRHIVASPERAAAELGFAAATMPSDGLPALASAPMRGDAR